MPLTVHVFNTTLILASFPGFSGTWTCGRGRAWYLFSREHDKIEEFLEQKGNVFALFNQLSFNTQCVW